MTGSKIAALTVLTLLAGCIEGSESATTANSSGGMSTGTVVPRSDGGYNVLFTAQGNNCSATYNDVVPGGTELSPVTCSGGGSGNATLVYGADGKPEKLTFGGLGIGSGTLVF